MATDVYPRELHSPAIFFGSPLVFSADTFHP
jgi:hypothetical protein